MTDEIALDTKTGRKLFLDHPDTAGGGGLTFVLNLHGGGSAGVWQRGYFPAKDHVNSHRLVVASPTAATSEPFRYWTRTADDDHLRNVVELVFERFGAANIDAFWLVGHSQGGMTSNRLLATEWFADRVDGWLSLSGGRIGRADLASNFGPPPLPGHAPFRPDAATLARMGAAATPDADFSFIFATGEHEIASLPATSPWAEKYGAGPRERRDDVVDVQAGQVHDTLREGRSNAGWGLAPRPGTAEVYVYPNGAEGRVIADVVRLDKGHTEGLEPRITETLVSMMVAAPGGKAQRLMSSGS